MSLVNAWALGLLNVYLAIRFRLSFHKLVIDSAIQSQINPNLPILFIANHSSWWDGFFVYELYKKLRVKKDFKVVMLESELKKFPFFRLCGAVGLIPKNEEHNAKVFLGLKNSCVCFFPQGQMTPQGSRPLIFKYGINNLIQTLHPVQIISVAILIEPFQFMKPTALIKAGSVILSGNLDINHEKLAQETEQHLDEVAHNWTSTIFATGL
jgi:1-acyl-sn-glycerol-3-phosphate acyltransferase